MHTKISISQDSLVKTICDPLFDTDGWFSFNSIEARSFNCTWGYAKSTSGSINRAKLEMTRVNDGWEALVTGGTFDYSWFKRLKINKMKILIKPSHLEVTEASFTKGGATYTMSFKVDQFGVNPQFSGGGKVKDLKLREILSKEYQEIISGEVNMEYTLSGSPNHPEGLEYTYKPLIEVKSVNGVDEEIIYPNSFKFTNKTQALRSLVFLDTTINYKTYVFDNTDWLLKMHGDRFDLPHAKLASLSDDKMRVEMKLAIKEPHIDYIDEVLKLPEIQRPALLQRKGLQDKANELLRFKDTVREEIKLEREDYIKLLNTERHLAGTVNLYLHALSFPNREQLREFYSLDNNQERKVEIKLAGPPTEATEKTAKKLYSLGIAK